MDLKKKIWFQIFKFDKQMYVINVTLNETIVSVNIFGKYDSAQYYAYDWSVNKTERLGFKPKFGEFKTYIYKVEYNQPSTYIDKPWKIFY